MQKIRFGILGSGFMGRTHAEAVRRLPNAELVAVTGGSRAPALAADYGAACDPDVPTLLARRDIDAAVITTPHHVHVDEAVLALDAGKHVLVEKPLATAVSDADRMIAAAQRNGRALCTAYHQRFRVNNAAARQLIAENAIGTVQTIQISMPTYAGTIKAGGFGGNWDWWNNPASLGHILNSAPHAIDMIRWLTGAEVQTVTAFCRTLLPDVPVEDTTMALLSLSNGAICSLFSTRALPAPAFPGGDFWIRVTGSHGWLDLDPYKALRLADDSGCRMVSTQPVVGHEGANTAFGDVRMQAYTDQIASFIEVMGGKHGVIGSAQDGRAGVAACIAMLTASAQRRWVEL